jgi:hypothetical protein
VVLAKGIWIDLTRNICGSVISDSFFFNTLLFVLQELL